MRGLDWFSRTKLAWKALTSPFSPEGAQAAQGLLAGILRGTVGPMPARNTPQLLQTFNASPWIRACASRVADSKASVQWTLAVAKNKQTGLARSDMAYAQRADPATRARIKKDLQRLGELKPIEDHLFLDIMTRNSDYMTGRDARWIASIWFDLVGEVFLLKQYRKVGKQRVPCALWPIPPHWVVNTPTPERPFYRMSWAGWQTEVADTDVLHMQSPNPLNPYDRGSGLGNATNDEVASDEYAAKHQLSFFRNSARPDVVITPKEGNSFTEPERERFETFWNDELQGTWRRFKPLFLKTAVEIKVLEQNFRNVQLRELREQSRDTIIQTWGIPPEMFGITTASNRSTIDMAPFIFATYCLVPRLEKERDLYQFRFLPEFDERLMLDYVSPVPEDKLFKQTVMQGQPTLFTKNEFRQLAGMPEREEFGDDLVEAPAPALGGLGEMTPDKPGAKPPSPADPGGKIMRVVEEMTDEEFERIARDLDSLLTP